GARAEQEAAAAHDEVRERVGERVAVLDEERRREREPGVVPDVVREPDADEEEQACEVGRPEERRGREARRGRLYVLGADGRQRPDLRTGSFLRLRDDALGLVLAPVQREPA